MPRAALPLRCRRWWRCSKPTSRGGGRGGRKDAGDEEDGEAGAATAFRRNRGAAGVEGDAATLREETATSADTQARRQGWLEMPEGARARREVRLEVAGAEEREGRRRERRSGGLRGKRRAGRGGGGGGDAGGGDGAAGRRTGKAVGAAGGVQRHGRERATGSREREKPGGGWRKKATAAWRVGPTRGARSARVQRTCAGGRGGSGGARLGLGRAAGPGGEEGEAAWAEGKGSPRGGRERRRGREREGGERDFGRGPRGRGEDFGPDLAQKKKEDYF
uniref:BKRF1 encodes EBNA-1 protein-like n=1 Tax=Oryza nivara TaxID=4536 RepID=A0A679BCE3_ORYNI|nr:BKRF1 encodes EBNA-1 protein-like [Oryza sativa f. spontanea]